MAALRRYFGGAIVPPPRSAGEGAETVLGPCLWAAVLAGRLGQHEEAKRTLAKASGALGAKAWMALFADETSARGCFQQEVSAALGSVKLQRSLAELAVSAFNDFEYARKCLVNGAELAKAHSDDFDWRFRFVDLAEAWRVLFDDSETSKCCLQTAESAAQDSWVWIRCAEAWQTIFQDSAAARRCLHNAESAAPFLSTWIRCAEAWQAILKETAVTNERLQMAESAAKVSKDWYDCAKAWQAIFIQSVINKYAC